MTIEVYSDPIVQYREIRLSSFISVGLTVIAILLACIGVGTPSWNITYSDAPTNTNISMTTSLFYTCYFNGSSCTNYYYSSETYYYHQLRTASGLSIVGILFLLFGALGTLKIGLGATDRYTSIRNPRHRDFHLGVGPICLLIASLIMLSALAEGARLIYYNGYSANLYQTAHVISFFALLLSAYASARRSLVGRIIP